MKLSIDCIRDILICLENHLEYDEKLIIQSIPFDTFCRFDEMQSYNPNDILYASEKLHEGGFIQFNEIFASNSLYFASYDDLTYSGHQLLETIRPETVFQQTKSKLSKIGSFSLNALAQISAAVLTRVINNELGIN